MKQLKLALLLFFMIFTAGSLTSCSDDQSHEISSEDISYHREFLGSEPEFNSSGHAKLLKKDGYYLVDRKGNTLHKIFMYDNGPDYESEGLYRIVKNGKIGFVDDQGVIQVEPKYDFAFPFEDGKAKVCTGCKEKSVGEYTQMVGGKWSEISNPLNKK
jgi:hypothetical protein